MEGIYHDKLYLYYRYVKDPQIIIDYLNTDWVENGSPRNDIPWIIENKCLDLKPVKLQSVICRMLGVSVRITIFMKKMKNSSF